MADDDIWDVDADVVVVGSGAAGFAAAFAARHEGASVVMVEKAGFLGGTTAKSGAYFWIPNNHLLRERGLVDDRDQALRLLARLSYPQSYVPEDERLGLSRLEYDLLAAFFDNAAPALQAMTDCGAFKPGLDMAMPDYCADLPEDTVPYGRHIFPDGWRSQQDIIAGLGVTDGSTRGEFMIAEFERQARLLDIDIRTSHEAVRLITDDSDDSDDGGVRVVGLELHHRTRTVLARARKAVVFASGGFAHNADMRRQFLRGPVFGGCAAESATGDFVTIAGEVGAQLGNMSHAWWSQIALEMALAQPSTIRDVFMPFGDSMVLVNRFGKRVVNEKMVYNERSQVHFEWDATHREYSNLLLFQVYDDAVANNDFDNPYRVPVPMPGESVGYVLSGDTIEELAAALDARLAELSDRTGGVRLDDGFAARLRATITRFDRLAESDVDEDFGRGESPIQRAWIGPPRHHGMANPTMHPFAGTGPYHAIILGAGMLDTKGGPRIDAQGRVLDVRGEPIRGLYGAGNCVASPAAQAYWSAGATLGVALTFGYIAGRGAAAEQVSDFDGAF
ncbi:FAD-dependent oxidoreductase [Amycolatopsis sp. GM8]|uniref:FAD-dependent oxidoreductase n=1 Tax=Amycolatopsis sp. GM8 TaxID=2896530 RepID=UPI001F27F039|nr:FAD-dependent oxidoreductase [Amycolatopsis sp. GM8]